jgi:hypothetical protein
MSNLFSTTGNTYVAVANTSSGTTTVAIPNAGQFMLDNTGNVAVFVNHGTANTVAAVIPTTGSDAKGFWVQPNQTKWFSTNITFNQDPAQTWYVAAITASGSAALYVTRCNAD